jgi:DegV family protein with EDD domain
MVDDLSALRRGGRIPGAIAAAGTKLDVKPLLTINLAGKLETVGFARGRKKGIKAMVDFYKDNMTPSPNVDYVCLGHADCEKDLKHLKEALQKVNENIIFVECNIGPVIGSHVGPGMLALSFWGTDKREKLSVADKIAKKIKGE